MGKLKIISQKVKYTTTKKISEITKLNASSGSFDFLNEKTELYSLNDVKKNQVQKL